MSRSRTLIDIGANLAHDSFEADRDEVLSRAWAAGLRAIVVTGSSADSSRAAAALAQGNPRLFATAGLHPHHATELDAAHLALFRELAAQPHVVALGECGLDYFRNYAPHDAQRHAFERQIALAAELHKPVFLHQRDAHADFLPILRAHRGSLPAAVVHCFTDGPQALEDYLALDCHIGITGWVCDERRGGGLRELVPRIPANRLLVETDAPYLLPRTLKPSPSSRRNEPAFLTEVLRVVAQVRGEPPDALARTTAANARHAFRLTVPG
ncbi:MAG TPA: TatD family hydrolase [Candidatus Binatia bacterium]|nr:TatD family hydrolase [Candidatus Binatia bacterium]